MTVQSTTGHTVSAITTCKPSEIPGHLEKLYEESCGNLDESQKDELRKLLIKYSHCFSSFSQDSGMTDLTEQKIDTGNSYRIKQAPRRIPLDTMAKVEKEMQDMLEKGVIETIW